MTTITEAIRTIQQGLGELAEALETGQAVTSPRPVAATPSAAPAGTQGLAAPNGPATFSDGLPIEEPFSGELEPFDQPEPIRRQSAETVLSECPVHLTPWTVKEGGISKAGKPYAAFWKCSGKNQDGTYCSKKPTKAWADSHPAEAAA